MRIEKLDQNTKKNLLEDLLKRSPNSYGKYEESVRVILDAVKERGDEALSEYTKKFDGAEINASNILVTEDEVKEAYDAVDPGLIEVIRKALVNIRSYHEKQMQYSWFDSRPDGTILGQKVTALARVGVYVPGGKAAYQHQRRQEQMAKRIQRLGGIAFQKAVDHIQARHRSRSGQSVQGRRGPGGCRSCVRHAKHPESG